MPIALYYYWIPRTHFLLAWFSLEWHAARFYCCVLQIFFCFILILVIIIIVLYLLCFRFYFSLTMSASFAFVGLYVWHYNCSLFQFDIVCLTWRLMDLCGWWSIVCLLFVACRLQIESSFLCNLDILLFFSFWSFFVWYVRSSFCSVLLSTVVWLFFVPVSPCDQLWFEILIHLDVMLILPDLCTHSFYLSLLITIRYGNGRSYLMRSPQSMCFEND